MDKNLAIKAANILYDIEECENVVDELSNFRNTLETNNQDILGIIDDALLKFENYIAKKNEELNNL